MKLVGTLASYAVSRAAPEELQPRNGIAWGELSAALKERYNSSNLVVPNQMQGQLPVLLQNGEFDGPNGKVAIEQLWVTAGGAVAVANDTDAAQVVLKDLMYFLDHSFEFRFASAKVTTSFVSDLVVQFESGIGDTLSALGRAEKIVSDALKKKFPHLGPYGLKRIGFGQEAEPAGAVTPLDNMESVEFTIERRLKQPFSENKFYCRAPLPTKEHLEVLEALEAALEK